MGKIKDENKKGFTHEEIFKKVSNQLLAFNKLNFLERYAMFMGRAQLVELDLKHRALEKGFTLEEMDKWTLGTTIRKLESKGLRPDYVNLLEELLKYRNDMAHDFLVSDVLGKSLIGIEFQSLSEKQLRYALRAVVIIIAVRDALVEIEAEWFISKQKTKKVLKEKEDKKIFYKKWLAGEMEWSKEKKSWVGK